MDKSHFIVDIDLSYQYKDLPAIASHSTRITLRPGLDGVEVLEAIHGFIVANFTAPEVKDNVG